MRNVLTDASRRAFAALILFGAVMVGIGIARFRVWWEFGSGDFASPKRVPHSVCSLKFPCYSVIPAWTIPTALAVALVGLLLAAVVYAPRNAK